MVDTIDKQEEEQTAYSKFYNNTICKWIEARMNFTTVRDNSYVVIYRDLKPPQKQHVPDVVLKKEYGSQGYHLCRLVKNDVAKIDLKQYLGLEFESDTNWFVMKNLKENLHKDIIEIDINACYWRLAYVLGFITERTYKSGLRNKNYKKGRNTAIGALASKIETRIYRYGECVDVKIDEKETRVVRQMIVDYTYKMSKEILSKFKNDILWFETDCFFTTPRVAQAIVKILKQKGFNTTIKDSLLLDVAMDKNGTVVIETHEKQYLYDKYRDVDYAGDKKKRTI